MRKRLGFEGYATKSMRNRNLTRSGDDDSAKEKRDAESQACHCRGIKKLNEEPHKHCFRNVC